MWQQPFMIILTALLLAGGCAAPPQLAIETGSSQAGGVVMRKGQSVNLLGDAIVVGQPLPAVELVDSRSMKPVDLSREKGKVLFLSIVPSIETKVCETQTHFLAEEGDALPDGIERITISRDTPMAQQRFAQAAKLTDIRYLSDFREGRFGMATGLLIDDSRLLARSVVLVDKGGIVRYIQVVPEMTHLPDMEKAFDEARKLL